MDAKPKPVTLFRKPKLMDSVRAVLRMKHYSWSIFYHPTDEMASLMQKAFVENKMTIAPAGSCACAFSKLTEYCEGISFDLDWHSIH